MLKSLCSSPSTSLPSLSFTVTGTVTKLTVRCRRNNSSRPLPPVLEAPPAGAVLIPSAPGGGASGLVGSGNGGEPLRVFGGASGFPLEEEGPWSSGVPCDGRLTLGAGALFCGLGASGNFCSCAIAWLAAKLRTTTIMADWIHELNRRLNMYRCRLPYCRNCGQYNRTGTPRQP